MNDEKDDISYYKEKLEKEFVYLLEIGEDVSHYLYIPYDFLTDKIRDYLDDFLIEKAYEKLQKNLLNKDSFIVYDDKLSYISVDSEERQLEILYRMMMFFTEKEEYEKCTKIKNFINNNYSNG